MICFNWLCYNLDMSEHGVGGRTPPERRRLGAHPERVAPQVRHTSSRRSSPMTGPGFFEDPALKNPNIFEFTVDPEYPVNYVWVKAGPFSTGPINSDVEDHGGILEGRVRVASPGKTLKFREYGGMGSFDGRIIEVEDPRDRRFLGKSGWWPKDSLSNKTTGDKKPREAKPLKLRLH